MNMAMRVICVRAPRGLRGLLRFLTQGKKERINAGKPL